MNTDIAAVEHRSTPSHSGANTMHTMQRFLESIKWDEEKLRDRCQQIVAKEHAHRGQSAPILADRRTPSSSCHFPPGR